MTEVTGNEAVAGAVLQYLELRHGDEPGIRHLVDRIGSLHHRRSHVAADPPHEAELDRAVHTLRGASDPQLASVGEAINRHAAELSWRADAGTYYDVEAKVGDGYRLGNMHAPLIEADDFAMGLFLLKPEVNYLDHHHAAPELYLNLTGPTGWRFDGGEWISLPAGSVVWNEPGRVHATRSGPEPWLSFWAWLDSVDQPCEVVRFGATET